MTQKNPWYLRKYKLTILNEQGDKALELISSDFEPKALRMEFRIERPGYRDIYYGEIKVFNLAPECENAILDEGYTVILEAGYKEGAYGIIFRGNIFQVLWDRQNVTDTILTLNCIDGLLISTNNFISMTIEQRAYQKDIIQRMAAASRQAIRIGHIDDQVETKQLPRGKVLFGEPKSYLQEYAQDNKCQYFVSNGEAHIAKIDSSLTYLSEDEAFVINPENGLIGTPQQTHDAVIFRCLLNPNLTIKNPPMLVKLDQTLIRQQKIRRGVLQTRLDEDGLYRVAGIMHIGDTRGNEWYTEVVAVGFMGKLAATLDNFNQTVNGKG
jgi:hypothetical protein